MLNVEYYKWASKYIREGATIKSQTRTRDYKYARQPGGTILKFNVGVLSSNKKKLRQDKERKEM